MTEWVERHRAKILVAILLLAAALRIPGIWVSPGPHPDERHMVSVAFDLSWDDLNPKSFAYGSLNYYLVFLLRNLVPSLNHYDGIFILGRALCVFLGVLGVYLTYLLARKITHDGICALSAAFLLATNFFHIQLSRFYTSDVILTTLVTAAILFLTVYMRTPSIRRAILGATCIGLAAATKIGAVILLPVAAVTIVLACGISKPSRWIVHGTVLGLITVAIFLVAQPYAFFDFDSFVRQNREQIDMTRGLWRPPYTVQYVGTVPYLYHLEQWFFYTMGGAVTTSVLLGFCLILRQIKVSKWSSLWIPCMAFFVLHFGMTAGLMVKFPRYLLPLYPLGMIFAGALLSKLILWRSSPRDLLAPVEPPTATQSV